jgi:hypothetical protein
MRSPVVKQHIEFTAIGMRAYLIGHLNKFVGGLTHRRNDRYDPMTTSVQLGETARDRVDFCRGFKTGAAVFFARRWDCCAFYL